MLKNITINVFKKIPMQSCLNGLATNLFELLYNPKIPNATPSKKISSI